ncbi:MAG: M23 family metallopeptidase [Nitrospirae bacterium]|nr:M23 family metallopeptidase [Nitrospirota bacterium]
MMEQTSFGKDRVISAYMPYITAEIAKDIADNRGMGIGEFFLRTPFSGSNEPITPPFPLLTKGGNGGVTPNSELKLSFPVKGKMSSQYGLRHDPIDGKLRHHNGIDIAVPEGTSVTSAESGKVVFSGYSSGYGNCIIMEHENGLTSLYAHNSLNLVKAGDIVDKGKTIALSGSTGRATGPHLHFEVRKDGATVDPVRFIG